MEMSVTRGLLCLRLENGAGSAGDDINGRSKRRSGSGRKAESERSGQMTKLCKKNTYNITSHRGKCPQNCPHGAWNTTEGICGAECRKCGGTLYLTNTDQVYCDNCGIQAADSD